MANKAHTAIILEGTVREPQIINNMIHIFFSGNKYVIVPLPVGQNIYMLWKQMKEDGFNTDIIEVVRDYSEELKDKLEEYTRDDFGEVFLFFDYDGHQNNLGDDVNGEEVLKEMLQTFNDETENGKLYVSYPMVESVRDYEDGQCQAHTSCFWDILKLDTYKERSAINNPHVAVKDYTHEDWKEIMRVFSMRVSCLYQKEGIFSFEAYRKEVSPYLIFLRQLEYIKDNQIFVLSGFPEFLLEYYGKSFWNTHVKRGNYYRCNKH